MDHFLPLIGRETVADGTMSFTLDAGTSGYQFKAGQNADFTLIDPPYTDEEGSTRTFSIVNSPQNSNEVTFATRMRDTAFKNSLREIALGTKLKVSSPMGQFTLPKDTAKQVAFLAGGIGITPFMSMLQWADDMHLSHRITLLYSNRTKESTPYFDQLERLAAKLPDFTFVSTLTGELPADWQHETGTIDSEKIKQHVSDLATTIFYIAGPVPMAQAMITLLEELGIPEEHVKVEDFPGY